MILQILSVSHLTLHLLHLDADLLHILNAQRLNDLCFTANISSVFVSQGLGVTVIRKVLTSVWITWQHPHLTLVQTWPARSPTIRKGKATRKNKFTNKPFISWLIKQSSFTYNASCLWNIVLLFFLWTFQTKLVGIDWQVLYPVLWLAYRLSDPWTAGAWLWCDNLWQS